MYLILLVIDDPDQLEDLLIAWEDAGVPSATVLFSTGMGRIRKLGGWRDDMPLIPSLNDFYRHGFPRRAPVRLVLVHLVYGLYSPTEKLADQEK